MNNISKYNDMPLQTISRKVWSSFIDGLLLLIVGAILTFTAGFSALRNNETFAKYNNQCFDNIKEMYKIQDDAKLQIIINEENTKVLSPADYFDEYIIKQINLSYLNFKEDFTAQGITLNVNDDNYSTVENDNLAYYFINYKINNNINIDDYKEMSPLNYFKEEIFFKNINKEYFIDQENTLPIIKSDVAIKLYNHYSDIEHNKDLYYEFSDAVLKIRNIGLNDLKTFDAFDNHYELYSEAYNMMSKYNDITLIIVYAISFVIIILLPSIITKDNITLGKLLTRTRTIHNEGYKMNKLKVGLTCLLSFIVNAFIIIFISLFSFGFENLTYSLFKIGTLNISFLFILLMSFAFMIINFIVIIALANHRSLIDVITNTKQMDITTYVEVKVS